MNRNLVLFVAGLAVLLSAPLTEAGSVFLKNGYIIQGKVVEKDPDKVVLGFSNGKMTIYSRFIDEVVLLPQEEDELRAAQEALQVTQAQDQPRGSELITETEFDLPQDLDEIILAKRLDSGSGTVGVNLPGMNPIPGNTPPENGTDGGTTTVNRIPQDVDLPEPVDFPQLGISMVVPTDWTVTEEANRLTFRKSADAEQPSFSIELRKEHQLEDETTQQVFQEVLVQQFPDLRITGERFEQIGFRRAYVVEGELPSANLYFTQALVTNHDHCYLVGLHVAYPMDQEDLERLKRSFHSIEFLDH